MNTEVSRGRKTSHPRARPCLTGEPAVWWSKTTQSPGGEPDTGTLMPHSQAEAPGARGTWAEGLALLDFVHSLSKYPLQHLLRARHCSGPPGQPRGDGLFPRSVHNFHPPHRLGQQPSPLQHRNNPRLSPSGTGRAEPTYPRGTADTAPGPWAPTALAGQKRTLPGEAGPGLGVW